MLSIKEEKPLGLIGDDYYNESLLNSSNYLILEKMPDANLPESFNVLMHELKGLGLDIKLEE